MEQPREQPWAEHEKVYLLAEIIKASLLPSHVLFDILRDHQVQPRWTEIALPQGRSLRSCQIAYGDLNSRYSVPDLRQHQHQHQHHQQQQQQPPAPLPPPPPQLPPPQLRFPVQSPPDVPQKRVLQPELSTSTGRLIQPRPPHAFPLAPQDTYAGQHFSLTPMGEPPHKKKRGRPSKAEAQARADAAAARGEVYPPPSRRKPQQRPWQLEGDQTPREEAGPAPDLQATIMESPGTPSITAPPESEDSPGRKRRAPPARLDLGEQASGHGGSVTEPSFQSSSAQLEARPGYHQPTPTSEAPSPAMERRDVDVNMGGADEFQHREQQQPQQKQHHQTSTPRSFKETVGM